MSSRVPTMEPMTIPAMPPPEMLSGQLQLSDEEVDCRAWRMLDITGAYVRVSEAASMVP
jgi:hypothetical protein